MSDVREQHGNGESQSTKQAQNRKPSFQDRGRKPKSVKVRRSRSTSYEKAGRERGRRRERGGRERGRSEEAHRRDRREGASERGKAKPPEDNVEETECVVCFCSYDNIFKTPKLLACGHTFCLECLARINVSSLELKSLSCPICRELTELPHGRDLPQLGNNQDVFRMLPPEMQRATSIRFQRSKGKLLLKHPPPSTPINTTSLSLPKKKQDNPPVTGEDLHLGTLEQGVAPTTELDVGRPPNQVRGRLRRLFHSDRCYYAAVASIITIAVVLMLVGILAFVIMPNVIINDVAHRPNNNTVAAPPGVHFP